MRGAVLVLAACGGSSPAITVDAPVAIDAPKSCPCPTDMPAQHSGLEAIEPCAFPIAHTAVGFAPPDLPVVAIDDLDFNRTLVTVASVPGTAANVQHAYQWQSGDETVAYWVPQGITGSWDAHHTTKRLAIVSWYYKQDQDPGSTVDKGVRIAIVDLANNAYRFALLVEPTATGYAPVKVHAGGLAWVGDKLYVPVTASGFRVFDLAHILQTTSDDANAYGYLYLVPQIGTYTSTGACSPVFSFAAVAGSSLISGEYDATSVNGRLYRWPLDGNGDLGAQPSDAFIMAESYIQGAAAIDTTYFLSSSRPTGGHGELVRTQVGAPSQTFGWSDSPEDLSLDGTSLWSLSEGTSARYLFEASAPTTP